MFIDKENLIFPLEIRMMLILADGVKEYQFEKKEGENIEDPKNALLNV